jgi:hypothetical protein
MAAGLAIKIGGDVSGFDKAMTTARNLALKNATSIATSFTAAGAKIDSEFAKVGERIGANLAKGIGNGLKPVAIGAGALVAATAGIALGYATISSAIGQANAQIERFLKLGQNAERSGIGVEFFQRFSEAASKAKIDVGEIESALKRAGSVVTPKFEQEDTLKTRLNQIFETGYAGSYQSKGLADYNAAGTNEQRIRAAVTAMQELRDLGIQAAAIEIGDKLFGPEVADRIRNGRLDIDAIAASLDKPRNDLVTQQQVDQAAEFRDRLDAAYTTIDQFFHVSVALEGSGRAVLDVWLMIAEAVAKGTTNVSNFYDKVQASQGVLGNYLSTVTGLVAGFSRMGAENLNDKIAGTRTIYDKAIGPEQPGAPANAITNPPAPPRRALDLFLEKPAAAGGSSRAAKSPATNAETLDQVQTAINGIERSTEALKAEADAIGKSAAERQSAINVARVEAIARQQGITLTADQIAKVKDLSKATVEYRDAIDDARDRQEALRSIGGDVLHGIASDARNGASALDILTSAVSRLVDRLSDKALDNFADQLFGKSGGSSGGIFGTLFGSILGTGGGSGGSEAFVGEGLMSTPIYHGGGLVGASGGRTKIAHPGIFKGAPRFHTGLTAREFPAILERGERVLTAQQDRRLGNTMAGLSQAVANRPAPEQRQGPESISLAIDVRGATGNAEVQQMVNQGVQAGMQAVTQRIGRNIGPMIKTHQQRF